MQAYHNSNLIKLCFPGDLTVQTENKICI